MEAHIVFASPPQMNRPQLYQVIQEAIAFTYLVLEGTYSTEVETFYCLEGKPFLLDLLKSPFNF
jgi:hypothetical protein